MTGVHQAKSQRSRSRSILIRAAFAAGCAALLSGCHNHGGTDLTASVPSDYRQRHPIVIKEKAHTVQLFVGSKRAGLTSTQRADVLAFAQTWKHEATGGIVIDVPYGSHNTVAARAAAREATSILVAAGVPAKAIATHGYHAHPRRLATVKLSYPRMAAEAGPCGLWPADLGTGATDTENKPYWNFGCATQRNLAAMVADPADLVQPRGESPAYRQRRTTVLEHYRAGEKTSSSQPYDNSAKISDVGK